MNGKSIRHVPERRYRGARRAMLGFDLDSVHRQLPSHCHITAESGISKLGKKGAEQSQDIWCAWLHFKRRTRRAQTGCRRQSALQAESLAHDVWWSVCSCTATLGGLAPTTTHCGLTDSRPIGTTTHRGSRFLLHCASLLSKRFSRALALPLRATASLPLLYPYKIPPSSRPNRAVSARIDCCHLRFLSPPIWFYCQPPGASTLLPLSEYEQYARQRAQRPVSARISSQTRVCNRMGLIESGLLGVLLSLMAAHWCGYGPIDRLLRLLGQPWNVVEAGSCRFLVHQVILLTSCCLQTISHSFESSA